MDQNLNLDGLQTCDHHYQYHHHDPNNVGMKKNIVKYEPPPPPSSSRRLPSSNYKGVVPQPNGRWGAQIYQKHQRVWLGTFNEEEQAAKAYDIAILRFRGPEPAASSSNDHASVLVDDSSPYNNANNTTNDDDDNGRVPDLESIFLFSHSKAEIVDMLRKHTYLDELEQYKCHHYPADPSSSTGSNVNLYHHHHHHHLGLMYGSSSSNNTAVLEYLFDKVATPSDVGKLNRFVVPKQHAQNYFPLNHGSSSSSKGVLMNFEDSDGKVWRFRYSYWGSSHSYVFSKGWTSFVKEKDLRAGDVVIFQRWRNNGRFFIDCSKRKQGGGGSGGDEEIVMHDGGGDHDDRVVESGQVARRPSIKLFGVTLF